MRWLEAHKSSIDENEQREIARTAGESVPGEKRSYEITAGANRPG